MSKARDIADLDFNAPDIDGGNIDGATIGATTAAAGTFLAINSGAHLINASSSAFGGSSVQGSNTDFLVDTGQGYTRHNSYHTGGSNHQFLVNEAGSTTNAVALSIAKDKSATFSSSVTAGSDIEIRSGNKLILQRPNNAVASNISTDSTGAMILDSLNGEGFFFNNNGTNAFKIDPINATFKGNVTIDNDSADPYLIIDGSTGSRDSGIKINSGGGERQVLRQDNGNNLYIGNNALLINSSGNISTTGDLQSSGQITSARGSDTGTYGFRHEGAGKYLRMGVPNASFAYFETDANGGFSFEGDVTVPNKITHAGDTDTYMQFHQNDGWRVVTANLERFHIQGDEVVFNHDGHDQNFRVESDNQVKAIYVDGGNDSVQILGNKFLEPVAAYYISSGTLNRNITVDLNDCGEYYLIIHITGIWPYAGSSPGTRIIEVTGFSTTNVVHVIRNTHYGSGPTGSVTVSATGNDLVVAISTVQNYRWSAHCEVVHGGGGMSMSVDGNDG